MIQVGKKKQKGETRFSYINYMMRILGIFFTNVQGDFKSPSKQKEETIFSYINGSIQHMVGILEKNTI